MIAPQTITGNNRKAGLAYIFIVDFVIIGLILIAYFFYQNDRFMELFNSEPIVRSGLIIGLSLSTTIHFSVYIWLAIRSFQSKSVIFNPQKVFYLRSEKLQWESEYPYISQVIVKKINSGSNQLISQINMITNTPKGKKNNLIKHKDLSQDKLTEIIKAFKQRKIKIS